MPGEEWTRAAAALMTLIPWGRVQLHCAAQHCARRARGRCAVSVLLLLPRHGYRDEIVPIVETAAADDMWNAQQEAA